MKGIFYHQWPEVRADIHRQITYEITELEQYAEKPEANKKAVELRRERLQKRAAELDYFDNLFTELNSAIQHEYQRGYQAGQQRQYYRDHPEARRLSTDKELDRLHSIQRFQQTWPELG